MTKLLNKLSLKILVILLTATLSACDNRPDNILSQSKMADILFDMHKLEGTFTEKSDSIITIQDKRPFYNSILSKYNISQSQFDSSIVWYSKYPKKYERVYDNVIERLTLLDQDVKNRIYHPIDSFALKHTKVEIWDTLTHYSFNKDSKRTKLQFEITDSTLQYGDKYKLTFLQKIAIEDSCTNSHIVIRINYANGIIDSIYQKAYNDDLLKKYCFKITAKHKSKIKSISGELLGSKDYKGVFNAKTDSISLIREYNSLIQDSIKQMILKIDTVKKDTIKINKPDSIKKK